MRLYTGQYDTNTLSWKGGRERGREIEREEGKEGREEGTKEQEWRGRGK